MEIALTAAVPVQQQKQSGTHALSESPHGSPPSRDVGEEAIEAVLAPPGTWH
jgi:hypothetical protein